MLRTAYATLKGQLVRSIMYPKPVDFSFTKDLFKFVFIMSLIAACGFAYTIAIMIIRGANISKIILRALDIITIVVPPALPGDIFFSPTFLPFQISGLNAIIICQNVRAFMNTRKRKITGNNT